MTRYTHLTEHERDHIYLMNKQKKNCTLTGDLLKPWAEVKSTISREIKRNTGGATAIAINKPTALPKRGISKSCDAWNFFAEDKQAITSITSRNWAKTVNQ